MAVYAVSGELGHSSTDMVEGVYSHWATCATGRTWWSTEWSRSRISWGSGRGHSVWEVSMKLSKLRAKARAAFRRADQRKVAGDTVTVHGRTFTREQCARVGSRSGS